VTHLFEQKDHDREPVTGPFPAPEDARVLVSHASGVETREAIEQVLDEIEAEAAELVLVFFAMSHDADVIAEVLDRRTGARGVGGTTAGELGELGFTVDGISAIALHGTKVRAALEVIPHIDQLSLVPIVNLPDTLARRIGRDKAELSPDRHFWLTLVDGLSGRESLLTPFFAHVSPHLSLIGGALADVDFDCVRLVHHGRVFEDAAAFALIEYERPFFTFHVTHHHLTDRWFTVTEVSEDGRTLWELDGRPAREVYAEALGVASEELDGSSSSPHPFGTRFRGRPFPVSIMTPLDGGGLLLGAPVHHGERINLLEAGDLVEESRASIARAIEEAGGAEQARGMLLFHCYGRFLEAEHGDLLEPLFEAMHQLPLCGFNTLGEQYGAMHVNHSITGVVFG
jgi:hypothetical protein